MILSVSILAANLARLEEEASRAVGAGAQWIHVDVMDGHFVPNITMGPVIVRALRPLKERTGVFIDVHLMIEEPHRYVEAFAEAGADGLTVHAEARGHLHRTIEQIHGLGVKAGVALNPATPLGVLDEMLPELDLVLVMTVNPGFAGQGFIPGSVDKVTRMRRKLVEARSTAHLQVDGGIKPSNVRQIVSAGADVVVVGSGVFGTSDPVEERVAAMFEQAKGQHG